MAATADMGQAYLGAGSLAARLLLADPEELFDIPEGEQVGGGALGLPLGMPGRGAGEDEDYGDKAWEEASSEEHMASLLTRGRQASSLSLSPFSSACSASLSPFLHQLSHASSDASTAASYRGGPLLGPAPGAGAQQHTLAPTLSDSASFASMPGYSEAFRLPRGSAMAGMAGAMATDLGAAPGLGSTEPPSGNFAAYVLTASPEELFDVMPEIPEEHSQNQGLEGLGGLGPAPAMGRGEWGEGLGEMRGLGDVGVDDDGALGAPVLPLHPALSAEDGAFLSLTQSMGFSQAFLQQLARSGPAVSHFPLSPATPSPTASGASGSGALVEEAAHSRLGGWEKAGAEGRTRSMLPLRHHLTASAASSPAGPSLKHRNFPRQNSTPASHLNNVPFPFDRRPSMDGKGALAGTGVGRRVEPAEVSAMMSAMENMALSAQSSAAAADLAAMMANFPGLGTPAPSHVALQGGAVPRAHSLGADVSADLQLLSRQMAELEEELRQVAECQQLGTLNDAQKRRVEAASLELRRMKSSLALVIGSMEGNSAHGGSSHGHANMIHGLGSSTHSLGSSTHGGGDGSFRGGAYAGQQGHVQVPPGICSSLSLGSAVGASDPELASLRPCRSTNELSDGFSELYPGARPPWAAGALQRHRLSFASGTRGGTPQARPGKKALVGSPGQLDLQQFHSVAEWGGSSEPTKAAARLQMRKAEDGGRA